MIVCSHRYTDVLIYIYIYIYTHTLYIHYAYNTHFWTHTIIFLCILAFTYLMQFLAYCYYIDTVYTVYIHNTYHIRVHIRIHEHRNTHYIYFRTRWRCKLTTLHYITLHVSRAMTARAHSTSLRTSCYIISSHLICASAMRRWPQHYVTSPTPCIHSIHSQ